MSLATSSSQVLVNGLATDFVLHRRGLRQGDPLSPFLFDLAMDPLQRVLEMDTSEGVLSKLPGNKSIILASFYADDVALFINPSRTDASIIRLILTCFGNITGLVTNRDKSSAMPIRCQGLDINHIFFFSYHAGGLHVFI